MEAAAVLRFLLLLLVCILPAAGQSKKILVQGLSPADVRELQQSAPTGVSIVAVTQERLPVEIRDADGVIGSVNAQLVRSAPRLKWVQTHSAGVDGLRFPEMLNSEITLTNAKIVMGPNIADHAFALLLALTRQINVAQQDKIKQSWDRSRHHPIELSGKTAVIIGAGGIGMQIAQRARGFGMTVIGVDPKDISYTPLIDLMVPPDRLDEVLPRADVVFVAAPLTPQSERMVGARQFELMKKGAYFIAVSRGKLYDTPALVKALDSGKLGGAGLDVTDPEPLPAGHPLWQFENTIITPHSAGQSDLMPVRRMQLFKDNIRRFAEGKPMINVVDKQRGY